MNPELPDEAVAFGEAAARAFARLGGVDAARRAEETPAARSEVADALQALGVDDLDARNDADSRAAAGALCEAAGRVVLPFPVAAAVLRDDNWLPFAVVPEGHLRVDHGDLFDEWHVATVDGRSHLSVPAGPPLATRLGPFVTDLRPVREIPGDDTTDVALHITLTGWQVLGTCARAVELAVAHVSERVQFGKPLSAFQAVQFQLADASVAVAGLRELARFTLWRLEVDPDRALPDALALRVHALDATRLVLRTAQQLHGAAGFCDEYDISVLARHVQPALRLPWGAERSAVELMAAISSHGFDGLFAHGGAAG